MPTVTLFFLSDFGLIIIYPSGVMYTNQVGGTFCLAPEAEGIFVPLIFKTEEERDLLYNYFTSDKWQGICAYGIDDATADFIDDILSKNMLTKDSIKVDRTKLSDSCEAWIWVRINEDKERPIKIFEGFNGCSAILTWENSD